MNSKSLVFQFLIYFILLFLFSNIILAQEKVIFNTEIYTFNSDDGKFVYSFQIFKKVLKDEPFYELFLNTQSKVFLGLDKANIMIKTDKKEIKLSIIKRSYENWFDKDNNLWNEKLLLKIKYADFDIFLKSSSDFIIIKGKNLSIKNKIPSEFKQFLYNFINYSKEIGVDVEKTYKPIFFIGLQFISFPIIYIYSQTFSSLFITQNNYFHLDNMSFLPDFMAENYNFEIKIPIKFLFFSSLNLKINYLYFPFQKGDQDVFFFNIFGLFGGFSIKFFTLFKLLSFSMDFAPGIFITTIYDEIEESYFPTLNSQVMMSMIGAIVGLNIDFKISNDFYLCFSVNSRFNVLGVIFNTIEIKTMIGF